MIDAAQLVGGLALVVVTLTDAIGTLVAARGLTSRWRPTRHFYWVSCVSGGRLSPARHARQGFLSAYAPLTLLTLLDMWLVGLPVGWAFVYSRRASD